MADTYLKVTIFAGILRFDGFFFFCGLAQKYKSLYSQLLALFTIDIRICQPCAIFVYKLQNLVIAKRVLNRNRRKMYLQIIVTLRTFGELFGHGCNMSPFMQNGNVGIKLA